MCLFLLSLFLIVFSVAAITDILENMFVFREWSDETLDQSKESGQSTIESMTTLSQLVIASHIPSEFYVFETESMKIQTSKIAIDMDFNSYCGNIYLDNIVTISNDYIDQVSQNGRYNMDCIFMTTKKNVHLLSIESISQYNNLYSKPNSFQCK